MTGRFTKGYSSGQRNELLKFPINLSFPLSSQLALVGSVSNIFSLEPEKPFYGQLRTAAISAAYEAGMEQTFHGLDPDGTNVHSLICQVRVLFVCCLSKGEEGESSSSLLDAA